jgi:signal transduction histidine kinase
VLGGAKSVVIDCSTPVGRAVVQGDPGRLRQLLHVLLDNAIRYAEPRSRVEVVLAGSEIGVALRVADRGAGIPQDDLPHVFERFYRGANAAERHRDGSGLGLPMAKAIVEVHRGSIELSSTVGEGTTVVVQLPAMRELRPNDVSAQR